MLNREVGKGGAVDQERAQDDSLGGGRTAGVVGDREERPGLQSEIRGSNVQL